jgi:two-component system OmpR family response regulator
MISMWLMTAPLVDVQASAGVREGPSSSRSVAQQRTARLALTLPFLAPAVAASGSRSAAATSERFWGRGADIQTPHGFRRHNEGMTAPRILVVDDEPNIRDLLITSLRFAGFQVRAVSNGAQTISAVLEEEPDLIILDVMLPDMNGFSVTKRLRGAGYTAPILFLTAKDETEDKITGLNAGGDDYVTKPFSLDEIVARIQAILRRTMQADEESVIRAGEITMDQDTHDVQVGEASIDLSPTEFKLLRYLMLNPNRVLSKAQILDHVWEYDFNGDAGIVESYISYLRRKIDPHSTEPLIQTKRGFGYMLKAGKTA